MSHFLLKTEMSGIRSLIVWPFLFLLHKPLAPTSPRVCHPPPFSPTVGFPSPPQISFRPALLRLAKEAADLSASTPNHSPEEPN